MIQSSDYILNLTLIIIIQIVHIVTNLKHEQLFKLKAKSYSEII